MPKILVTLARTAYRLRKPPADPPTPPDDLRGALDHIHGRLAAH
jgi:hypothetical protein